MFRQAAPSTGSSHLTSSRRSLLAAASATLALFTIARNRTAYAASNRIIDVTTVSGVDPTGASDSTSGFQTALTTLQSRGGGELYIPPGTYKISSGLSYTGQSLSIFGCGQTLSVLNISGALTVFSITLNGGESVTVKDMGFCPTSSGGIAFQITGPTSQYFTETQNCLIENVDFCVVGDGATAAGFGNILVLANLNRTNVRNANSNTNTGPVVSGGSFASLTNCIDTRFNNCSFDGTDNGFVIASYSEGLHINDCVVICNTGISTGAKAYNTSNGEVNLLGLYISNCEFNCTLSSAVLSWVNTAWITGTHFSTGNVAYPAMSILGCLWVTIDSCEFTGFYGSGNWTAIQLGKTADGWSTSNTKISNCVCVNIGIGISMQPNTFNTAVTSWTMSAPAGYNGAGLVGGGCSSTSSPVVACVDNTGNTTNLVQWVTSAQPASGYSTDRLLYSRAQ